MRFIYGSPFITVPAALSTVIRFFIHLMHPFRLSINTDILPCYAVMYNIICNNAAYTIRAPGAPLFQISFQIVLDIKIRRIVMTQYEKTIFPDPTAKSIRLDVYADDSHNRKYSVEMQGYVEYNIGRRSRYYQSVIDIDSLSRGHGYERLSDAFVIFVCTYDPFGAGMQKYVFKKRCINADSGMNTWHPSKKT